MNPIELYAYPQYAVVTAILIGICLAVFNPRMLFFAVLTSITVMDWKGYFYTRFEATGPYLNVFDLLIIFGLLAAFLRTRKDDMNMFFLWYMVFADLILGFMISYMQLGFNYEVLRIARWALNVPLLWLIGQRCICSREDARIALYILLVGCFAQSVRQCLYVAFFEDVEVRAESWRTIRFLNAGYVVVPVCFLLVSFSKNVFFKIFLHASIGVSVIALILTQTRSFLIPQALIILLGGWILARSRIFWLMLPSVVFLLVCAFVFYNFTPNKVDIADLFLHGRINDFSSGHGREAAIYYETKVWLNGNVIFGQGLGFHSSYAYSNMDEVAWGHNGYTAYLSNLGFLGFVLFGVLVPRLGLSKARVLWNSDHDELKLFGLVSGCLICFLIIESALTAGLLAGFPYALNIIFLGGACSLAQQTEEDDSESNAMEVALH